MVIISQLHPILAIRINSVLTVNNQRRGGIDKTVVVIILAIRINSVLTVNNDQRRGGIDKTVVVIILARVQLQYKKKRKKKSTSSFKQLVILIGEYQHVYTVTNQLFENRQPRLNWG